MIKLFSSPEDRAREKEVQKYTAGRAGIYPGMLKLVLNDPSIAEISKKISAKIALTQDEADILVKKYCTEQARYRSLCDRIADWVPLNRELLFLDTLGTDISPKIYALSMDALLATERLWADLPVDSDAQMQMRLQATAEILSMTLDELEKYGAMQLAVLDRFD